VAIKGRKILLITVDGRDERAAGMNLHELAHFMKWIKADKAINLDGGGSTTLWIREGGVARVVNHPSGHVTPDSRLQARDSRIGSQRPVANAIVIKLKNN
jgi:exopolysaccharide biosynthesis protein